MTVGQIVVVVAVVAKRETRTQIVTVAAINQSINQDPVYTGKCCLHGSGQIFERTNCLPIQPVYAEPCKFFYSTAYTSPYKFLPISALEWLFNQRRGTRIYALTAQTVQKFSQWS